MTPIYHMRTHTLISTPRTQIHTSEINNEAIGAVYVHIHPPCLSTHAPIHIHTYSWSHILTHSRTPSPTRTIDICRLPTDHRLYVTPALCRKIGAVRSYDPDFWSVNEGMILRIRACLAAKAMVYSSCDRRRRG